MVKWWAVVLALLVALGVMNNWDDIVYFFKPVPSTPTYAPHVAAEPAAVQKPAFDLEGLSQSTPRKGMPEEYIDRSGLGAHDREKTEAGRTTYYWLSRNGCNDVVFMAACENGTVVSCARRNSDILYWRDARDLPDLYSVEPVPPGEEARNKYNPRDSDSAEDWEADTGGSLEEWDFQE